MFSLHLSDNVKTITQDKQTAKRNSLFERNFCFCFFRSRHLFTFFWGVSYLHRLLPCDKLKSFVFAQMPSVSNIHTKVQEWGTTKRNSYQLSIGINIASETDKHLWILIVITMVMMILGRSNQLLLTFKLLEIFQRGWKL